MRFTLCIALFAVGCSSHASAPTEPIGSTHVEQAPPANPHLRTAMRSHYGDLREIERLLRAGKLAEAKALAYWLTQPIEDSRITPYPHEMARVTAAAQELMAAPSYEAAARSEARVAVACGGCHARAGATAAFEHDTIAPRDMGTFASRLARHKWAYARVWDGIVGASDLQWRAGLEVYQVDIAGYRVHAIATRGLENPRADRAQLYGDLLVSCQTCHPSVIGK